MIFYLNPTAKILMTILFILFCTRTYGSTEASNQNQLFSNRLKSMELKNEKNPAVTWVLQGKEKLSFDIQVKICDVMTVASTERAFTALLKDGTTFSFGSEKYGGCYENLSNVEKIMGCHCVFIATFSNKNTEVWGGINEDGFEWPPESTLRRVEEIYFSKKKFDTRGYAALSQNGNCFVWGDARLGGEIPPDLEDELKEGIESIHSTIWSFTALLKDSGRAVSWGRGEMVPENLYNIEKIFSNDHAFVALFENKCIMTWGMGRSARAPKNIQNVEQIYCAKEAFVAHLSDGTAIAWGEKERGGRIFDAGGSTLLRVQMIASTNYAFAAVLENKVVTWGWEKSGCVLPHEMELKLKNVKHIYSNPYAFVVVKEDGTPFAWGDPNRGGEIPAYLEPKLKNVYKIFSNDFAFVALLATGEVYTWGNKIFGGEIPENIHKQLKNVENIFSTSFAFAALREDKKLLTWGHQHFGYSIQVSLQKQVFPDDPSIFGQESDLTPKKPRRRSTMGTGRMSQWDKFKTIVSDSKNSSPAAKRKNRRSSVKR